MILCDVRSESQVKVELSVCYFQQTRHARKVMELRPSIFSQRPSVKDTHLHEFSNAFRTSRVHGGVLDEMLLLEIFAGPEVPSMSYKPSKPQP
jgi:hypothetical protein